MKEIETAYNAFLNPSSKKVYNFFGLLLIALFDIYIDASVYGAIFTLTFTIISMLFLPAHISIIIILAFFALDYSYTNMSFGGYLNEKTTQNDYVRTSSKMKQMFLKLTYFNAFRRLLNYVVIFLIFYITTYKNINILKISTLIIFTFAVGEWVAYFGYYMTNSFKFTPVALIGLVVSGAFLYAFVLYNNSMELMVAGIVLGIIGIIFKIYTLKRKVCEDYYGI